MSPPPLLKFIAKARTFKLRACPVWFRRIVLVIAALFGTLAAYLLSFGPVARFYGANPYNAWSRLPPAFRALYKPMDHIPMPRALAATLGRYNHWWMAVDRQQKEFINLMARIDSSIRLGMTHSEVVATIGPPLSSDSQGNQVFATYVFQAPGVGYDLITNGFTIAFSNGVVVRKSPITSRMR